MCLSTQLCILVLTGSVLLSIFSSLEATIITDEDQALEAKKNLTWLIAQEQVTSGEESLLRNFKEWQNNSDLFYNVSYQHLAGTPSQQKKLLTLGLCSKQGIYLMHTLQSVFKSSSKSELMYFTVVVHLSDSDPKSLRQRSFNISRIFAPQILRGQLLVIHTPLAAYSSLENLKTNGSEPFLNPILFKQIADYAFLMNFAANLSDYFLMIEDNVRCAPNFIADIQRALAIWKERPWVIMEFSQLDLTGKLCHSRDLPRLASFFLYYLNSPPEKLFSTFYKMLGQEKPIQFSPSLFRSMDFSIHEDNFSSDNPFHDQVSSLKPKDKFQENNFGKPNNPPAFIYTDMQIFKDYLPEKAYSLEEDFFWALEPMAGNHLTVALEEPAKIRRVQVLTGPEEELVFLLGGKVELGYNRSENTKDCMYYVPLGALQNGKFDHKMLYKEMENRVSCLRLVVTTTQDEWIMIKHINIWTA
ncbi:alpha-1,6-mannosyl-glycoprotein 4-beta-N-acetylglucosaminyltransferase-like [Antechinus flavipes]|uniref:alpha-1,6-mannosyl-glycoprotein 4-beta-N-acetylglucosaminyltransferase-like n=1 Tax=Antechinus flavipes TaxID=38775 RepID=UPI00223693DD|nr:alpha-1,6-mannosyl-glycoprotein 4-beta-N-acetylglucosaminyltransferase-like [Antechinus flavipes]